MSAQDCSPIPWTIDGPWILDAKGRHVATFAGDAQPAPPDRERMQSLFDLGISDPAALVDSYAELLHLARLARRDASHPAEIDRVIARAEAARK